MAAGLNAFSKNHRVRREQHCWLLRFGIFVLLTIIGVVRESAGGEVSAGGQQTSRPNILIIMPDDVGYWNVGAYSHGMMVPTPNIDRIAREGMLFTDHYSQPTCTPGRAALITGQLPIRTGLTTVGMAGSPIGLDGRDPTLAEILKAQGYRTGQFGKNHLVIAMSIFRRCTGSMSSMGICITSIPRKNLSLETGRRIRV